MLRGVLRFVIPVALLAPVVPGVWAQFEDSNQNIPMEVPPPQPPKPPREDAEEYKPLVSLEEKTPLPEELLERLQAKAMLYQDFARQFTCDEISRQAEYKSSGESSEKLQRYAYTLISDTARHSITAYRQEMGRDGSLKGASSDAEPFPPAYAWVLLFTEFHEPYFSFHHAGQQFEGFDLVHVIHFKGSLPWTTGKDIRQWQGRILVDAVELTPLQIEAEPASQQDRLNAMYEQWSQSFNILGFRTRSSPLGYRASIQFRFNWPTKTVDGASHTLHFPTELRYDTYRAVSRTDVVPLRSSTRSYKNYRFFSVTPGTETVIDPPPGT